MATRAISCGPGGYCRSEKPFGHRNAPSQVDSLTTMGLLDEWRRRAMERREGRVEFLGEQSGSVEDLLKRDLIFEFATRPDIRRAYLARDGFQPEAEPTT